MLGPCARTSVLLLPLMAVALWAAPLTKYDQRQEGELNVHAHLENFVILLIPGGLRNLNIAAKVAPGRGHDRKHARPGRLPVHASVTSSSSDAAPAGHGHGLKAPPYHVDIDAERQAPIVLEITAPRGPEQEHQDEVVIAESPAVVLTKKPLEPEPEPAKPAAEEAPAPQESAPSPLAEDAAAQPSDDELKPSAPQTPNKIPSKLVENKPELSNSAAAPPAPAQDPAPIRAPAPARAPPAAPATVSVDKPKRPTPTIVEKPKRPISPAAVDKPKKPVLTPAAVAVADVPAAPAEKPKRPAAATLAAAAAATAAEETAAPPAAESEPSAASETPSPAPAAPAAPPAAPAAPAAPVAPAIPIPSAPPAAPAAPEAPEAIPAAPATPAAAQAQEARARKLAAGLVPHAAAGTACAQGTCIRDVEPVRVSKSYEDSSFMRALQFGLEPAQ